MFLHSFIPPRKDHAKIAAVATSRIVYVPTKRSAEPGNFSLRKQQPNKIVKKILRLRKKRASARRNLHKSVVLGIAGDGPAA
jgi:hypothetical protein